MPRNCSSRGRSRREKGERGGGEAFAASVLRNFRCRLRKRFDVGFYRLRFSVSVFLGSRSRYQNLRGNTSPPHKSLEVGSEKLGLPKREFDGFGYMGKGLAPVSWDFLSGRGMTSSKSCEQSRVARKPSGREAGSFGIKRNEEMIWVYEGIEVMSYVFG